MKKLHHNVTKIKDPSTGTYRGLPAIAGESAYDIAVRLGTFSGTEEEWNSYIKTERAEAVQVIQNEGTAQKSSVAAEGAAQVRAVQDKGTEVLQNIPEDYTALQAQADANTNDIANLRDYVSDVHKAATWDEIATAAATGLADDMFAIGDEFSNVWSDTVANKEYDNPLRVNHFEDGELEDGTIIHGMWLQTHYAQLKAVQFSHQRAFLRCPDGLAAGTYYFTIEKSWGNNNYVVEGDVVCFTTTIDVPAGGRISGCYGAPDQNKSNWKIYTHSADGKTVLETIAPSFEASGTDLGIQKLNTRNGNLNSTQEMAYGWNRWKTSALRQYLNSENPKGKWWTAQDEWDIAPDQLNSVDGYLCGMDPELLSVIQPVKTVTYANTVNDGGEEDVTYDKIIIPSLEQMYVKPQIVGEGECHQYYEELNGTENKYLQYNTYEELKHFAIENHASAQTVRLRSAGRGNSCHAWFVGSSCYIGSYYASPARRFAPLVFISKII